MLTQGGRMAKAKRKYRKMKEAERREERSRQNREKAIIEKMRKTFSRYAGMEDYRRGRLL